MIHPKKYHQRVLQEKGLTPFFHRDGLYFCLLFHGRERVPQGAITAALLSDRGGLEYALWFGVGEWVQVIVADHSSPNEEEWTLRDPDREMAKFYRADEVFVILGALRKAGETYSVGGEDAVQIVDAPIS